MNALQVDPETGFLDSNNINGFSAERKLQFITLCKNFRKENNGKWPDFSHVCESLGITNTTLDRHLKSDAKFREEFRDLTLGAKYKLESNLYDLGSKKGFEALIWLRRFFPEEYNPDYNKSSTVNVNIFSEAAREIVSTDAIIVDPSTPQIETKGTEK